MRYSDADGFYELNQFPACNQVVVSNHAFIYQHRRGKGAGQIQHLRRLQEAKKMGYDYIICTVNSDNVVERHILEKNKWTLLDTFRNKETGHQVMLYGRQL